MPSFLFWLEARHKTISIHKYVYMNMTIQIISICFHRSLSMARTYQF